jgi:hypothetical protein
VQLGESRSLVRLSVKKAAFADLSSAARRKFGVVLGKHEKPESVPKGRLRISQDEVLGILINSARFAKTSGRASVPRGVLQTLQTNAPYFVKRNRTTPWRGTLTV